MSVCVLLQKIPQKKAAENKVAERKPVEKKTAAVEKKAVERKAATKPAETRGRRPRRAVTLEVSYKEDSEHSEPEEVPVRTALSVATGFGCLALACLQNNTLSNTSFSN